MVQETMFNIINEPHCVYSTWPFKLNEFFSTLALHPWLKLAIRRKKKR